MMVRLFRFFLPIFVSLYPHMDDLDSNNDNIRKYGEYYINRESKSLIW